jgi:hypothetical protein
VRRGGIGTRDAIGAITAGGGIASLAHSPWAPEWPSAIDLLAGWGLGGLEVHYAGWDDGVVAGMARFARRRGLLATGGSDYHGDTGDYATAQAATHVPPEVGQRLLATLGTSAGAPRAGGASSGGLSRSSAGAAC